MDGTGYRRQALGLDFWKRRSRLLRVDGRDVVGAELQDDGDQFFEEIHFVEERVSAERAREGERIFVIGGRNGEQTAGRV